MMMIYIYIYIHIWRFPFRHRGTPSHHPGLDGIFLEITIYLGVPLFQDDQDWPHSFFPVLLWWMIGRN